MKTLHFYSLATGRLTGEQVHYPDQVSPEFIASVTPAGCGVFEGDAHWQKHAVDLEKGCLVAVSAEDIAAHARADARRAALVQIVALEQSGVRALREVALGVPGGRERLQVVEDQIKALRAQLAT